MRIVITFGALDAAGVAESIPWPWYAGSVAIAAGVLAWLVKLALKPLLQIMTGESVPRTTVDLLLGAKNDEVTRIAAAIQAQREESVRAIAVIREEYTTDMAALRAEHIAELTTLRERHDRYMAAMDANHARESEAREREIERSHRDTADWRTAYHLAAEVGKVQAAQLDELVEGYRLILSLIQALPKVQHGDSEVVSDRAGRGATGRG